MPEIFTSSTVWTLNIEGLNDGAINYLRFESKKVNDSKVVHSKITWYHIDEYNNLRNMNHENTKEIHRKITFQVIHGKSIAYEDVEKYLEDWYQVYKQTKELECE